MRFLSNNLDSMQKIVNQLYEAVTITPETDAPPKTTMVQLCHPGIPVNENDYRNAMSRSNPGGDPSTALAFSSLIDNIPKCGILSYIPSGNSVDEAFGLCIQANATTEDNPEQRDKYQRAYDYLWIVEKIIDVNGNEIELPAVPTTRYQTYLDFRSKYFAAEMDIQALKNKCDLNTTEGRIRWSRESPVLIDKKDQALQKWSSHRPHIEEALNIIATTINDVTRYGIARSQEIYNQCKIGDPSTGLLEHVSFATPSNWYDESILPNMTKIEISHAVQDQTTTDYYESYSGGASYGWGLWSVGASGGHTEQEHAEHSTSTNMEISFHVASIQIERPWMEHNFFKLGNWYLSGQRAGVISSGEAPNTDAELLPQYPVQFFVARDIQISATWSERDLEIIKEATSGNVSVGWGCFKLSGRYESSSSEEYFHSEFDGTTLTVPGVQIIGFVSTIPTPLCPPIDDTNKNNFLYADIGNNRALLKNRTSIRNKR